jgi:hypothetical protein
MGRSLLGSADVSDEELAVMVAASLGVAEVEVTSSEVEVAEYDLETLTTAGRFWVRGTARHAAGASPYAFYVKVVQSWTRSAVFQQVPEPLREVAAASLPWRNEPLVYRSDLAGRLPSGLSLPRAHAVRDIDELSAALWLEAVDVDPSPWSTPRFVRAAYLLGRLAASPQVAPLRAVGTRDVARGYAETRVAHQILPTLRSEELWRHPLVAESFPAELRDRLLAAADAVPDLLTELDAAPLGAAHGDACPRNLLVARGAPDAFVLIDFGLWSEAPLGFDLSQLLLGEVQLGERPAAEAAALETVCLDAYVRGLRDEGVDVPRDRVRRAHALLMLLFCGLTAVPLEVVLGMPVPGPVAVIRERAQAARFVLDLVDATRPA